MKSLNLWRLYDKATERHIKFLQKINGIPVCLYYSVFALDYNKETFKKDGKPYIKGYINNQNAVHCQILVADFDKITESEHNAIIDMFNSCDIEVLSVFSGHGYQDIILLSEKVYDLNILKKFCCILKRKGFPVDENIVDPARVMRMPFSFNCKEFDPTNKYHSDSPKAIPTRLVRETDKRYSVKEIFEKLEMLPDSPASFNMQIENPQLGKQEEIFPKIQPKIQPGILKQ
ncbi:hypothetical protein [Thermoanaerobacterium sp. DL9XJH110]|uniref:hypothetical protein n=1 Tax=Thermoanaerobacterium sp. DL9XJH110 TaxID=3386643 RepID=UPI003BB5253F